MDQGKEIFTLKIQIKDEIQYLIVHENDEPSQLVSDFAREHNLNKELSILIEKEIETKIDNLINENLINKDFTLQSENIINKHIKIIDDNFTEEDEKNLNNFSSSTHKFKALNSLRTNDFKSTNDSFDTGEYFRSIKSYSPVKMPKISKDHQLYQFRDIFKYLKPNKQGYLTIENILQINLNDRLSKILMPLIIDIESLGLSLNYSEFCERMEILLRFLSPKEKSYLLG